MRIPEQRRTQHEDEMLGFKLPLYLSEVFHLYRYANVGAHRVGGGERWEWQLSDSRGEKKSWSEQNKERVWAAVTSCLTNVPPTLLRAGAVCCFCCCCCCCCCCCPGPPLRLLATQARSTVAWGGFLATLSSERAQTPESWEPSRGATELEHPIPAHRCLASLSSSPGTAQNASAARVLGGQTPEPTESEKEQGYATPSQRGAWNVPFQLSRQLGCPVLCLRVQTGASRGFAEPLPQAAGTRVSSPANRDVAASTSAS
nr:uncharacterized protein LOC108351349 [Rattus norvegicus]|eukprot:XP_017450038.1 PREDICTED: uncharacterized protein LOC108351349 [Rattus norvegicus]